MRKIIFAGLCALFLWSCASGPNDYTYQDMGQAAAVRQGTVLSIRPVKVSSQSGVGQIGGAVAGGALGSMIGGNTAVNIVGAVGGAILGGFFGNETEKVITKDTAYEFMVRQTSNLRHSKESGRNSSRGRSLAGGVHEGYAHPKDELLSNNERLLHRNGRFLFSPFFLPIRREKVVAFCSSGFGKA